MSILTNFLSAEDISDMNSKQIELLNALVEEVYASKEVQELVRRRVEQFRPAIHALGDEPAKPKK